MFKTGTDNESGRGAEEEVGDEETSAASVEEQRSGGDASNSTDGDAVDATRAAAGGGEIHRVVLAKSTEPTPAAAGTNDAPAVTDGAKPTGSGSNGASAPTRTTNIALVTAMGVMNPVIMEVMQRAATAEYKGSPAAKKKAVFSDMERLRNEANRVRTLAEERMFGDSPDAVEAQRLVQEAKACEAAASKLAGYYEELLARAERRAARDGALDALKRDPLTGKLWKKSYIYDPGRPQMRELYADKKHPKDVFADGSKLVRADGGKYGLIGSLIRVMYEAAERAGETVSDTLVRELVKGAAYDNMERVHGIGEGECRNAAWVLHLWSEVTGEPLRLEDIPVRHPIKPFSEWVATEFDAEYAKGLKRLGLGVGESDDTADGFARTSSGEPTNDSNPEGV